MPPAPPHPTHALLPRSPSLHECIVTVRLLSAGGRAPRGGRAAAASAHVGKGISPDLKHAYSGVGAAGAQTTQCWQDLGAGHAMHDCMTGLNGHRVNAVHTQHSQLVSSSSSLSASWGTILPRPTRMGGSRPWVTLNFCMGEGQTNDKNKLYGEGRLRDCTALNWGWACCPGAKRDVYPGRAPIKWSEDTECQRDVTSAHL